jgi:hypothetical protein
MKKADRYKIAAWVLSALVILQGLVILQLIRKPKKIARPAVAIKGKIAIVLDDWGYNLNNTDIIEQIKYPITASILPNLKFSREVAEELHRLGFQVILHLPMQPHEQYRLEHNTIMTDMGEQLINNIIEGDLAAIPHLAGVSNHMGSRATEDLKTMGVVFRLLKKRRLYFLDSLVSAQSVCEDLARKMHLTFVKRDVFLDNEEKPEYIRQQVHKLKTRARFYGQAIGIGHDRRATLEVLKEVMPQLSKEGYKFVYLSELVK